ncbi:hypothetical protein ACFLYB_01480 [Chloroflexota bacterium]
MKKVIVTISVVLITMSSLFAGCTSRAYSYSNFEDDFLDSFRLSPGSGIFFGESDVQIGLFPVLPQYIIANGERINVLEYDNEDLADEEASFVHPDGYGMTIISEAGEESTIGWSLVGSPHFFKKGRLIVQYVDVSHGSDPTVLNILESILGEQFAGEPKIYIEVASAFGPLKSNGLIIPAGPVVEITLKNVSDEPVISLTATLEQYISYEFVFDVTPSNPLLPGERISSKKVLIQGSISDNSSDPLEINATLQNGDTFVYTKQIQFSESTDNAYIGE